MPVILIWKRSENMFYDKDYQWKILFQTRKLVISKQQIFFAQYSFTGVPWVELERLFLAMQKRTTIVTTTTPTKAPTDDMIMVSVRFPFCWCEVSASDSVELPCVPPVEDNVTTCLIFVGRVTLTMCVGLVILGEFTEETNKVLAFSVVEVFVELRFSEVDVDVITVVVSVTGINNVAVLETSESEIERKIHQSSGLDFRC